MTELEIWGVRAWGLGLVALGVIGLLYVLIPLIVWHNLVLIRRELGRIRRCLEWREGPGPPL